MDPLDPTKNDESSGFSKRRISSILKAPRKSIRLPDPEQQENVVECAKPVEKRNSRRVSFAPANNVLLFSNDIKNTSTARSPLQDLMTTTAATQNRVQVALTEDGIQQITGMETLLSAPLHASQQRDKVTSNTGDDFGEKTVMFSTDDAFMDMTQSHTIKIVNSAELLADISLQNYDILPTSRERTVMFTADDGSMDTTLNHTVNITSGPVSLPTSRSMDLNAEKKNISSPVPCLDPGFENFLASLFKPNGPSANPEITRMTFPSGISSAERNSSLAQIKTQRPGVDKENQAPGSVSAVMEKSVITPRKTDQSSYGSVLCPKSDVKFDAENDCKDKTVRFSADGACMDVTQSHTISIATAFPAHDMCTQSSRLKKVEMTLRQQQSEDRGSSNYKGMETSLTASSKTNMQGHQVNFDAKDDYREKTVRFTADEACMDVTQSHTVNIATGFDPQAPQNLDFVPSCGDKTVRFSANDAAMDMMQSHTVNIAPGFDPQAPQNMDFVPACRDKTVWFSVNDADMVMTQSHTVNIVSNSVADRESNILTTHENMNFALSAKKRESETCPDGNRSSSAHTLDQIFKKSLSKMSGPWANPVITKAVPAALSSNEAVDTNDVLDQLKKKKLNIETESETPGFVSAVMENPVNQTMAYCPEDDGRVAMIEAQTDHILEQTCGDEPLQSTSTQGLYSNSVDVSDTKVTSQKNSGSFNPDCEEITNFTGYLDSNETDNKEEHEPRDQTCSSNSVDHVDAAPSRKTRRMSFADLHTKIRRLSHMINAAPDTVATDSCTAPLPQLEHDMNKTQSLPVMEPELEMASVKTEENTQAKYLMEGEQTTAATATPFNLKTRQLMSRLSVGGFKPKLPQRSKPDDPKKVNSMVEHTKTITVNVTNQLSNFDGDVSDIYAEELGSCEDMSEMLDTRSPRKATEKVSLSQEFYTEGPLEAGVFEEDIISAVHEKDDMEDESKTSTEMEADFNMGSQCHVVEVDSNFTSAPDLITQTTDESSSCHSASIGCEATFESTFKQSLFESQLEDYANDMQRKFNDGTITVLEFFKLFNIDFVIHNPRQSVLPERLLSDTDHTPMDLLKDRHINRPKHMVYETNVLNLTEKVEGLKERMRDLDKLLNIVNRPLWEEMKNSSEKELKSFGAKLKERNNLFRKMSKVQSHEVKEVLYSNLVKANLEEQQRLRGTIEESDEMIRSLDDCICEVETELASVEEKGFEDAPSLKSCQEEMKKVTEALADNDRQISELEIQEKQNSKKLNRLKAETRNLESHVATQHMVNEWKLGETKDNYTVYTFLHETLHLQLVFEKYNGTVADNQSERKISHIIFKHQIDAEKSQGHACLVHKLLSQYTEGGSIWVEKYPTSRHVPKLLHDVGLLVSRCRLLGEELRLLKMWGGLRLDILDISCVETEVHVVFSSLKKHSKFELIFSVSLTNHLYVLHVQRFKNMIGSTTVQQIKEIVASFSPGKNLLTKIVKKIHGNLLC